MAPKKATKKEEEETEKEKFAVGLIRGLQGLDAKLEPGESGLDGEEEADLRVRSRKERWSALEWAAVILAMPAFQCSSLKKAGGIFNLLHLEIFGKRNPSDGYVGRQIKAAHSMCEGDSYNFLGTFLVESMTTTAGITAAHHAVTVWFREIVRELRAPGRVANKITYNHLLKRLREAVENGRQRNLKRRRSSETGGGPAQKRAASPTPSTPPPSPQRQPPQPNSASGRRHALALSILQVGAAVPKEAVQFLAEARSRSIADSEFAIIYAEMGADAAIDDLRRHKTSLSAVLALPDCSFAVCVSKDSADIHVHEFAAGTDDREEPRRLGQRMLLALGQSAENAVVRPQSWYFAPGVGHLLGAYVVAKAKATAAGDVPDLLTADDEKDRRVELTQELINALLAN